MADHDDIEEQKASLLHAGEARDFDSDVEQSGLAPAVSSLNNPEENEEVELETGPFRHSNNSWKEHAKSLWSLSWPLCITFVAQYMTFFWSIMFSGQYGTTVEFDGVVEGSTICTLFGLSIGMGFATALDTICPQAVGANNSKAIGLHVQIGIYLMTLLMIPIIIGQLLAKDILLAMGQDEEVATLAGKFCETILPSIPMLLLFEILKRPCQAHGHVFPPLFAMLLCNVLNFSLNYFFVVGVAEMDVVTGTGVARDFAFLSLPVFMLIYYKVSGVGELWWDGWSWESIQFERWIPFLKLGGFGCCTVIIDWWAFEILVIFAGLLPENRLTIASDAIVFQVVSILFMFNVGLGIGTCIQVGYFLGAGLPQMAKKASHVAQVIWPCIGVFTCILILALRSYIPQIFSTNDDTIDLAAEVLLIVAFYQIIDGVNNCNIGSLKGSARQNVAALLMLVGYWIIGIPFACLLGFVAHAGLIGLWGGVLSGLAVCALSSFVVLRCFTDWEYYSELAVQWKKQEAADSQDPVDRLISDQAFFDQLDAEQEAADVEIGA